MNILTHNPPSIAEVDARFASLYESDWFMVQSEPVKKILRDFPPWGFYVASDAETQQLFNKGETMTPPEDRCPIRHHGIFEYHNKDDPTAPIDYRFNTIIALMGAPMRSVDGRPVYGDNGQPTIQRIEKWSRNQAFAFLDYNKYFIDGFMLPEGYAIFQPRE